MPLFAARSEAKSTPIAPEKRPAAENYDHLVPHANRALRFTLKAGWYLAKGIVKLAIHLPRLFVRANQPDKRNRNRSPHSSQTRR